ncbi:hypothetical protein ACRRTK_004059 [Alexandromys fortis]
MIPINGGPPVSKPSQSQGDSPSWRVRGRLPHNRILRHPYPSSFSPRCTQLYLSRACPSSLVLEFRVLSPLGCAQGTPKPSIIY